MPLAKTLDFIGIQKKRGYRILVYLSNISENKNQKQLVEISDKLKKKTLIILLGNEHDGGYVRRLCIQRNLLKQVIIAGFCDDISEVLNYSDLNVFLSCNDGFGLSIIEASSYGVPSIMFADLDAANDVYSEDSIILMQNRENDTIVSSIEIALQKNWNRKLIIEGAKAYSMDNIALKYEQWYKTSLMRINCKCVQ